MKTQLLDSPSKRIPIAVATVTGLILVAAAIYTFLGTPPPQPVNGPKIIAAAHAYTRALLQNHAPVPQAVPLQVLIDQGFLQPADAGSLQGMDASISLMARDTDPTFVLMRVHMPDGTDLVLLADGSAQGIKR
jgi:hypothetical protein